MTAPNDTPSTELVGGKYRLTRLLGRGGMGSVWEGVHSSLGTRVAVKFIESEYVDSAEARSRFENEARAAAKLVSKHVVKVHDHGVMADGRPYIVMEFLAGEPLDARLGRVGRLSLQETATIVQQVARALTKAHDAGIIHRDLKPENVFLVLDDEDGTEVAKVVDFGIAKFTDSSGLSASTRTGSVLGTPYYMSPEQARGLRSVDHRSDLWSLVVIAYRCMVGKLPYMGEAVGDLLVQICVSPTPTPSREFPGLPAAFDAWVERGLAKEQSQRFQTALELSDALAQIAGIGRARVNSMEATVASSPIAAAAPMTPAFTPQRVEGVTAAPFTTQNTLPSSSKSRPLAVIIGVAAAGVLFLGGLVTVVAVKAASGSSANADPIVAVSAPAEPGTPKPPEPTPEPSVAPAVHPPAPSASAEPAAAPIAGQPTGAKPTGAKPTGAKPTGASPTGGKPTGAKPGGGTDVGY